MRNAAQRKEVRKYEKISAERELARINFIVAAMSTLAGRTYFHELLARCHIFSDPFTGEALLEAYSKGERNIGLSIYLDIVTNCPDYFVMMMKEATIQEQTYDRRTEPSDGEFSGESDTDGGDQGSE
jgi:hypothetical protein